VWGIALSGAVAFLTAEKAAAQLTTQMLIGDSVSEIGTRYGDVDEAIKRFTNNDPIAARQFLESAKRKDAALPPVDLLLAKLYFMSNNVQAGRVSLEKTAMDDPGDPEAFLLLADQAFQQGRLIEAEALYDKVMQLNEKFQGNAKRKRNFEVRARAGRASVAQRRKKWDAAVADLQALVKADPENARAHYLLGQTLFMQKKAVDGKAEFDTAKKLDKDKVIPDPWVAAAMMYDQLDMPAETQKSFDNALKTSKTDPNTITAYTQWLIKSGDPANITKAETLLGEARKANPGNLNLLILSGVAARMSKKIKPAEDYLIEALGIAPANGDVMNQLALLLIEQPAQDKRDRALQFALINSRLNAESPDTQVTLAWVLYQLGKGREAEQALIKASQLGTPSQDSNYLVGKIFAEQNRPEQAKQVLKMAMDMNAPGIFIYRKDAEALLKSIK
jgi:Tfp pilus assembly protein PilF